MGLIEEWNACLKATETGWFIQSVTVKLSENDGYACNFNVASPTAFTATGDEHEKLRLPINLRVG